MTTMIDLDEELLLTAQNIADIRGHTLSSVINDLVWKGLRPEPAPAETKSGFPVLLSVRPGERPVTSAHVAKLMELEDEEILQAGYGQPPMRQASFGAADQSETAAPEMDAVEIGH
jgi:hypothetical protein